jgi:hypothetical protein
MSITIFSSKSFTGSLNIRERSLKELCEQLNRYRLHRNNDDGFDRCVKRGPVVFVHG